MNTLLREEELLTQERIQLLMSWRPGYRSPGTSSRWRGSRKDPTAKEVRDAPNPPTRALLAAPVASESSPALPLVLSSGRTLWVRDLSAMEAFVVFTPGYGRGQWQLSRGVVDPEATLRALDRVRQRLEATGEPFSRVVIVGDPDHAREEATSLAFRQRAEHTRVMEEYPEPVEEQPQPAPAPSAAPSWPPRNPCGPWIVPADATETDVLMLLALQALQCDATPVTTSDELLGSGW